jgi:hypothetical protein
MEGGGGNGSTARHWMEVSGQFYALTASPEAKDPSVSSNRRLTWASRPGVLSELSGQ